jgi:hypothetical protein
VAAGAQRRNSELDVRSVRRRDHDRIDVIAPEDLCGVRRSERFEAVAAFAERVAHRG